MATKTNIDLKIVDSVNTSHTEAEVLADSASTPEAFYFGRGYLAKGGEKVIESIDKNGTYPNVTVGFATDLSGRVEATPEVFTYRPSAGDKSIKDDNAYIRRVKGNSIVYGVGQILKEINADNWVQYSASYTDISFGDNECTLTVNSGYTGGNIYQLGLKYIAAGQKYLANHTYLAIFEVYLEYSGQAVIEVTGTSHLTNKAEAGKWVEVYTTFTPTTDKTTFYIKPPFAYQSTDAVGKTYSVRNAMLFDLTSLYEVEPTFEEFKKLYPEAYYRVGGGELRNLVCWGIKTVGFNQFNGTYAKVLPNESYYFGGTYTSLGFATEVGGEITALSIPDNRLYTPTSAGYIYATGTDICINLHHTGYRDGEYEPYKEVTHALPLSKITNGEPLRRAGNIYDEINETEYIRRIGIVDLGSLVWDYTSSNNFFVCYDMPNMKITVTNEERLDGLVCSKYPIDTNSTISTQATDKTMKRHFGALYIRDTSFTDAASFKASLSGVILNYELAEPIVTPIEIPIDFNYYVEDFGTEEAILAEDSAPFSADIIYQFNATDQVRNNSRNIQQLRRTSFVPTGTAYQYVRGNGTYGRIAELNHATPVYGGDVDYSGEGGYDVQFTLEPYYYARTDTTLDSDRTALVKISVPDNPEVVAEYWLHITIDETMPNIDFICIERESAVFYFSGEFKTNAVNICHIATPDEGLTFYCEIKNYSI